MLICLPLLSQQLQLCASPPRFRVFGVYFHPPGFLLRLLSCAPSTLYSTWVFFFFLVSFLWFWVSLSSFLLLFPLLEPSSFFLLSVRSLLGAVAVTPSKKKKKDHCCYVEYVEAPSHHQAPQNRAHSVSPQASKQALHCPHTHTHTHTHTLVHTHTHAR